MREKHPISVKEFGSFGDLEDWFQFPNWGRGLLPRGNWSLARADKMPTPLIDFHEEDNHYVMNIEISGMAPEDVDVSISDDRLLTISGEKKQEKEYEKGKAHYTERSYGKFQRTLELPAEVDPERIEASYDRGVIRLELPKAQAKQSKQIQIKTKES